MVALPSFLSFPWSLPLPSLPSISLPANIQRRFLSYVLKRSLGRFVRAGGLDVERIQAQMGEGRVEIEGLELDTEEINSLIPPSIPLRITSGSLDKVMARLPFPNLWSAPLVISLNTLELDLLSIPPQSTKGKSRDSSGLPSSPSMDLASSVTTAADEFLHEELDAYEEAELDRSIRQSIILSANDPFNNDDLPGAFPFGAGASSNPHSPGSPMPVSMPVSIESTTVLAGLVERVLARLEFKVENVKVRIHHEDPRHGGIFELRIGEIRYADESTAVSEEERARTVRSVTVSGIDLYMLAPRTSPPPPAQPRFFSSNSRSSSTSSTTSTSSTSSRGGNDDMIMSMAVADLRHSVANTEASGASMYASAISEMPEAMEEDDRPNRSNSKDANARQRSRSATPTPTARVPDDALLLSFGGEPVVLRMTTTRPAATSSAVPDANTPTTEVGKSNVLSESSRLPSINLNLSIGTIAAVLLPSQTATILSATQLALKTSSQDYSPKTSAALISTANAPKLEATIRVKAAFASIIYDLSAATQPGFNTALSQFWQKPSLIDVPVGHLKIRLDTLEATYLSPESVASNSRISQERTRATRKGSSSRKESAGPKLSLMLLNASVFEYLASAPTGEEDSPPGGSFPVVIFDSNLVKQYDHSPATGLHAYQSTFGSEGIFPEFDGIDWRNAGLQRRGAAGERVWRVKQKGRGVLKGGVNTAASDSGPVILIRKDLSPNTAAHVNMQPIHVFLDLSLLERLLPMLRHISPAVKRQDTAPSSPIRLTRPDMPARRSESYVLDDLDAQAAAQTSEKLETAVIRCPMVRISIRCPAPVNRRGTWGDGAHLRSGIVTLDLHGLHARVEAAPPGLVRHKAHREQSQAGPTVEWQKVILFFCRVPSTKSAAFLLIGPLAPEAGDPDPVLLLPSVSVKTAQNYLADVKTTSITCRIPSIQAEIRQSTIEGLQFFADDLTHWLDGAFGDGSRPKPRDELKMIGSRFFGGSKASSSASSSAIEDEEETLTSATIIRIMITETDIALHVPREGNAKLERILSLRASDLSTEIKSNTTGRQETLLDLTIMDAEFADTTGAALTKIISRTTPLTLTVQNHPIVHLRFSSLTDGETGTKETSIKTVLSSFTLFITPDIGWTKDLAAFVKTPEGVFEDVEPSEITRIALELYDASIHASASSSMGGTTGAVVLVLGALELKTDLISDADDSVAEVGLRGSGLFILDDVSATTPLPSGRPPMEAWTTAGYAKLVEITETDIQVWRDLTGTGEIAADVMACRIRVTACADSLASLGPLAADLAKIAPTSSTPEKHLKSPAMLDESINVFASVDENAFNRIPDMISGADLIEDDLPTNLDYLDHATRRIEVDKDRLTGESLRSWQATGESDLDVRLNSEVNGETVKILYDQPFEMDEGYWDRLSPVSRGYLDSSQVGKIRLRVYDATVNVMLHDGYDWVRTRKAIEDEIKSVRRKLEKIRQLLASGQTADESIENTRSVLFNSIYIGLDQSREMDSAALLAAIDEELGDLGNDASSISSWQTDFPAGHPGHSGQPTRTKKARLKGKRLTRSKKPQIEFSLDHIKVDVDLFGKENPTASRLHVAMASMEILDHIKTSTWKKFLTEMKADSRGNVRETDADMVRIELVGVRPSLPNLDEEYRLRAKVLPLRLHVDQDALDFLKRFFSFSSPASVPTSVPSLGPSAKRASAEPFFQHVEIFPIELKLDYKPKRVDFAALREGKTIELMNFFHFDGAEMTLRHITLSGISGVTRLSTTLQDIWTPDVKANQLADVISGVSPIRSIVNVGSGVADLILLPIEQYRKDGRVARGVQRGTSSFVRSTALEMMKLGAKLATGTQVILEKAEGVLGGRLGDREVVGEVSWSGSGPSAEGEVSSEDEAEVVSRYANQPTGAKEGVQAAYKSLSKNVNAAAQTILAVPMEVYERSGDTGPLKAVVRAVPIAVLKPMIGASEAVSKTLLGVRNSLDPQARDELGDKYK